MAGDWIKVEIGLAEKPEVFRLSHLLGVDRHTIIGKLVTFWSWANRSSVDGHVDGVDAHDVDALVDAAGFSAAMCKIKWLAVDAENHGINIPHFDRHNGESVKKRLLKSERQARWRENHVDVSVDAGASTNASTREEKRRSTSSGAKSRAGAGVAVQAKSLETWAAYSNAYFRRYNVEPVRNAAVNSQLAKLVDRLGVTDAAAVAAYYLTHDRALYVAAKHSTALLLRDAEGLRTEWATGQHTTETKARNVDRNSTQRSVWDKIAADKPIT